MLCPQVLEIAGSKAVVQVRAEPHCITVSSCAWAAARRQGGQQSPHVGRRLRFCCILAVQSFEPRCCYATTLTLATPFASQVFEGTDGIDNTHTRVGFTGDVLRMPISEVRGSQRTVTRRCCVVAVPPLTTSTRTCRRPAALAGDAWPLLQRQRKAQGRRAPRARGGVPRYPGAAYQPVRARVPEGDDPGEKHHGLVGEWRQARRCGCS